MHEYFNELLNLSTYSCVGCCYCYVFSFYSVNPTVVNSVFRELKIFKTLKRNANLKQLKEATINWMFKACSCKTWTSYTKKYMAYLLETTSWNCFRSSTLSSAEASSLRFYWANRGYLGTRGEKGLDLRVSCFISDAGYCHHYASLWHHLYFVVFTEKKQQCQLHLSFCLSPQT